MTIIAVTGTGTGVGKTVVTAALAAVTLRSGRSVAVLKPAQTGVAEHGFGDLDDVVRLAGEDVRTVELARYPEPLAPATAARRAEVPTVRAEEIATAARQLADRYDLVLIEGAGGLLVRFDEAGSTLADAAKLLRAQVLVVAGAGLGTLNASALTTEALRSRGLECAGLVLGAWPTEPDLACVCNLADLPSVTGTRLVGVVPDGAGGWARSDFAGAAERWLGPSLGGSWSGDPIAMAEA